MRGAGARRHPHQLSREAALTEPSRRQEVAQPSSETLPATSR